MMRFYRQSLVVWLLVTTATAAEPAPAKKENENVFSLLPKSLQLRPRVAFNILTTMSAAGKAWPAPTAEHPAYYVIETGLNRNTGVGVEEGLKSPPPSELQGLLERALATNHFRRAGDTTPAPTLVIIFHWGTSSYNPTENDTELAKRRALLDRAMLLAGPKFAKEIADAMEEIDRRSHLPPEIAAMMPDPIELLSNRSPEMNRLVEELFSSSYFVVATAFDHAAMAQGRGVVLWRTKMTVNSLGVNMLETVPPLIVSSAPFLGRETPEPVLVSTRISRAGHVEIGTPTVVEEQKDVAAPSGPPAGKR